MNIIELAEKAGMTRRPADRQCRAPYWDVVIDPELERFADLVLEEAAVECDKRAHAGDAGALMAARAIRALKGAKE
jgi:hypothetical protein